MLEDVFKATDFMNKALEAIKVDSFINALTFDKVLGKEMGNTWRADFCINFEKGSDFPYRRHRCHRRGTGRGPRRCRSHRGGPRKA